MLRITLEFSDFWRLFGSRVWLRKEEETGKNNYWEKLLLLFAFFPLVVWISTINLVVLFLKMNLTQEI